ARELGIGAVIDVPVAHVRIEQVHPGDLEAAAWQLGRLVVPPGPEVTALRAGDEAERVSVVVVLAVEQGRLAELLDVTDAGNLAGLLTGRAEDREEDGRHNHNDGDNHKKLDERKTVMPLSPTNHDSPSLRSPNQP